MNEKVSIIIPIYNVEKYLNRCLESVVNQTYRNLEIILVDDGSPDNCPQICDEWAEHDARIQVIHKANSGPGMARNFGLEAATGDYLMFVDSDDYLSKKAVEVLYERMQADGSDMAIGKHTDIYDNGTQNNQFCSWMKDALLTPEEVFDAAGGNYYPVSVYGKLYRRKVFENCFFPALSCGEDLWVFPTVMQNSTLISVVNYELYYYYQRDNSIIHQKTPRAQFDEIKANLYFCRFLLQQDFALSAQKWLVRALRFSCAFKNKKQIRALMKEYFTRNECTTLYQNLNLADRMRWLCLYVPFLYTITQVIKKKRSISHGEKKAY